VGAAFRVLRTRLRNRNLKLRTRLRNLNLKSLFAIFDSFRDNIFNSFRDICAHMYEFFEVCVRFVSVKVANFFLVNHGNIFLGQSYDRY